MKTALLAAGVVVLLCAAQNVTAQLGPSQMGAEVTSSRIQIDWSRNLLTVVLSRPIQEPGPAAISRAYTAVRRNATVPLDRALSTIRYDSRITIASLTQSNRLAAETVWAIADAARPSLYRPSADLSVVEVYYELRLFPQVGEPFVDHSRARQPPRVVGPPAPSTYTGLVIYAADRLPLHGTTEHTFLSPALFPGLYDQQMRRLLEREYYDPAYLKRWGAAAYISAEQYTGVESEAPYRQRIGENPLRILARGVFGVHATDPIITVQAAQILLSEQNRHLLTEGRILVIIDEEHAVERINH